MHCPLCSDPALCQGVDDEEERQDRYIDGLKAAERLALSVQAFTAAGLIAQFRKNESKRKE